MLALILVYQQAQVINDLCYYQKINFLIKAYKNYKNSDKNTIIYQKGNL